MFLLFFGMGATLFYYEVRKEENKIDSNELREFIKNNKIRKVEISQKPLNSQVHIYEARIILTDGSVKYFNVND